MSYLAGSVYYKLTASELAKPRRSVPAKVELCVHRYRTIRGIKVLAVGTHCTSIDTYLPDWQGPPPGYTKSPEHLATDERTTFAPKMFYKS